MPALLASFALTSCGFVDDAFTFPVTGTFGGRVQLDASALGTEPIDPECGNGCTHGRQCDVTIVREGGECAVMLRETLRIDVNLATALPDLTRVESMPEVRELGPVTYTFASNTLDETGRLLSPITIWLAPKNDADPAARVKLATLPAPPALTPAYASITADPEAVNMLRRLLLRGEKELALVVTTSFGPFVAGEAPPTGVIQLDLAVSVALAGKPLS